MEEVTVTVQPPLFAALDEKMQRIRALLSEMETCFESGSDLDEDAKLELSMTLKELYPRITAALERYGHADRARELRGDWEAEPPQERFAPRYHPTDACGFVDCYAYNILEGAIGILKDAFEHRQLEHERDRFAKAEEARRQEGRDKAQHERTLEVRKFEASEGRAARKWQLCLALITAAVGLSVGLGGNADKFASLLGRTPPLAQTVLMEGDVTVANKSIIPDDMNVDCSPHVVGVMTAISGGRWSLMVPPSVARPLKLYCKASSTSETSNAVTVSVPAGPVTNPMDLPPIVIAHAPQSVPLPSGMPSATATP